MKLVIEREKWLRGDEYSSYLLRETDQKMCCLGFYSLACGLTQNQIRGLRGLTTVAYMEEELPEGLKWLVNARKDNSEQALSLMEANDSEMWDDEERERVIAAKFAEYGVEVEFV